MSDGRFSAGREVYRVARAATPTHLHLRNRLVALALMTMALDALASVAILLLERGERGTEITNIGDAAFFCTVQLLTVSSNLPNPLSTGGRVVDVLLELWAISAVTALAGAFGAFFHRRGQERHPVEPGSDPATAPRRAASG